MLRSRRRSFTMPCKAWASLSRCWRPKAFPCGETDESLMIIACIDLQDGRAVQLVQGRKRRLAVDDVFGLLDRFREYPLLHVIDLDAAMGKGSNARLVRQLCQRAPMR